VIKINGPAAERLIKPVGRMINYIRRRRFRARAFVFVRLCPLPASNTGDEVAAVRQTFENRYETRLQLLFTAHRVHRDRGLALIFPLLTVRTIVIGVRPRMFNCPPNQLVNTSFLYQTTFLYNTVAALTGNPKPGRFDNRFR